MMEWDWVQLWLDYGLPLLMIILKILIVVVPLLVAVAYLTYAERKVIAAMQLRKGPNVVGPFGLLQPLADGLKLLLKEPIIPHASKPASIYPRADADLHARDARLGGDAAGRRLGNCRYQCWHFISVCHIFAGCIWRADGRLGQ